MRLENPRPTAADVPWIKLGMAIIEQACDDYITARYARLKFPKEDTGPTQIELDCVAFFHNQDHPAWFRQLRPDAVIEALNEIVDEAIQDRKLPRLHDIQMNSARYRRVNEE